MDDRELVQQLAVKPLRLAAMHGLLGTLKASEIRRATTRPEAFAALVEGLRDPKAPVRYWSVALLDHMADREIAEVVAPLLDDPVPRVRRIVAHALGCQGCRPGCPVRVSPAVRARLVEVASTDPNTKVRMEAGLALHHLGA